MSDSDSSEEENADLLREAADNEFHNDSMFQNTSDKEVKAEESLKETKHISLRPDRKEDSDRQWGLHVTPDFQKYVAKHLSRIIDSQIEEITVDEDNFENRKVTEGLTNGVRLLGTSNVLLSLKDEDSSGKHQPRQRPKIAKRKHEEDSLTEEERLKEAAVDAKWILSQEAIKGWEKNVKGKVMTLKASEVEIKGACDIRQNGADYSDGDQEIWKSKKKKKKIKIGGYEKTALDTFSNSGIVGGDYSDGNQEAQKSKKEKKKIKNDNETNMLETSNSVGIELSSQIVEESKKAKKKEKRKRQKEQMKLKKAQNAIVTEG